MQNKTKTKLVNLGCGHHFHKNWINLDLHASEFIQYYNIKNKLPFDDNSIDVVYHSHVLEHLTKEDGEKLSKECFRVLKPGGILRVCIPDLEIICQEYLSNLNKAYETDDPYHIKNYYWNKLELYDQVLRSKSGGDMKKAIEEKLINKDYVVQRNGDEVRPLFENITPIKENILIKVIKYIYHKLFSFRNNPQISGESHKWMYDKLDLKILFTNIGFKNFQIVKFDISKIPNWNIYKLDNSSNSQYPRKPDSIFIETIK